MEFSHLFSVLAAIGALLFFSAGFSLGMLKNARASQLAETAEEHPGEQRESARETAAAEASAREGARREALDAECVRLRLEVKASGAEVARLQLALVELERRANHVQSPPSAVPSTLPPALVDASSGVLTFQGILGRLSKTKGMRAAVLGDGLGLPVASLGDQSESLAGFCGFISQAASKARDFLQLGTIRRIVIEDERLATLTACSVGGTDLFLATLTAGPGPDFARMVQVLNDVKSFMSQRSPA